MTRFKKILLGSAAILLPGGFVVAAGYLVYKKFRRKRDGIQSKTSDTSVGQNPDQNNT